MVPIPFSRLFIAVLGVLGGVLPFQCSYAEGSLQYNGLYDFGSVSQGTKVVHEFAIKNSGTQSVTIQKLVPSCGCTAASVDSGTIEAGATNRIKVEFDTAGFSGSKTKTVEVLTSHPETPELVLTLKGEVVPGVVADPRRIEFGEISPGSDDSSWVRNLKVELKEGTDLKIQTVRSFSKHLAVTQEQTTPQGATYRVELSKDAPRGELRDRVVVEFEGGRQQSLNIPILASIRGDLRVVPSTVSFGVVDGTEPLERRVKFENSSKKRVKVQDVVPQHPGVTASFLNVQDGYRGVIVIRLDPTKVSSDVRTTVAIRTDHEIESDLSLNVYAVLPPK
jgi:hypothetical protein